MTTNTSDALSQPSGSRPESLTPVAAVAAEIVTTADAGVPAGPTAGSNSRRSRPPLGMFLALGWLALLIVLVILQPILPFPDPLVSDFSSIRQTPFSSWEHPLGTDEIGRDLVSRSIMGARVSLTVGIGAVALAVTLGMGLGVAAGYFGGWANRFASAFTDVMLAFPALVLLIALAVFIGPGMVNLTIGIGVVGTPHVLRVARAATLTFTSRDFVTAAKGTGAGHLRIMARELLPNVVIPVLAYALVMVAVVIIAEGGLSFLGLGVPPPTSSWGSMIAGGRPELAFLPHIVLVPAVVMFLTLLALNFLGDQLSKRFEIRESLL